MKKALLSILAALYITASSGAVIHLHYCMDKLVGWGLFEKANGKEKCDKCGMAKTGKKKGCCKDENKFVKIEKDQKNIETAYKLVQPVVAFLSVYIIGEKPILPVTTSYYYISSNAPPLDAFADVYIMNCHFRI